MPVTNRAALRIAGILLLFALTVAFVWLMPAWMLTPDMLPAFTAGILIIGAVCFASARLGDSSETYRRLTFLLWWVLLSSEEFFVRLNQTEDTALGHFAPEAFEEAMVWLLVFFCGAVLLLRRPGSMNGLWKGPSKWLSIYALLCVLSCAYATQKAFSVAWTFKLCVVVLLLQLCRSQIQDEQKLKTFLNATLWGVAFLTIVPPVRALFLPGPIFEDGRLGNSISPTGLSGIAGTLFLTALAFRPVTGNRKTWFLAGAGAVVMFLAGGKTSIVAGVLSAMLFFLMQKRIAAAVGVAIGVLATGVAVIAMTPVSGYLMNYATSADGATLTARTDLWGLAMPFIRNRPILGYGYASSRFISLQLGGVSWDPGHMHNGFLEALYNNGFLGLVVMLAIHGCILRSMFRMIRDKRINARLRGLAIGCTAIYFNILLNGMFNASFGGRAGGTFIVLLALLTIGERLTFLASRVPATVVVVEPEDSSPIFVTPRTA
ncbi:MAG: O-antigen ligase family protein [Bryobacteraceae bacterium]|jgi:O-antigen ligase